jgi:predicted metal-dependent HD superfamily phosphohydrolase
MKPSNLTSIEAQLQSDFSTLAERLEANETTVQNWSDTLISRYKEPQRRYHTIEHIHAMLNCLDHYRCPVKNETAIKLAIFFHDWVYDPKGKDNELESIKCFEEFAADISLSNSMISLVSGYIERTITHTLPISDGEADSDLGLFLDFDLEVLARNEADYALYAAQIRQEYGHFSEGDYCAGRIKVLKAFLERGRLYFSDAFYETCEEIARGNLKAEIGLLERRLKALEGTP